MDTLYQPFQDNTSYLEEHMGHLDSTHQLLKYSKQNIFENNQHPYALNEQSLNNHLDYLT